MRLYRFLVAVFRFISAILGVKFRDCDKLPGEGAVVLVANHRHWSDIVLMALAAYPRQVHFMAKSEYGKNKFLDWLIYHLGSFTVERGEADMKAIKTSLGYLRKGEVVGIFPEGTRNHGKALLPFKEGAFLLASRGRAMVVPLAIFHAGRYLKLGKPRPNVVMGEAFAADGFPDEQGKFDSKIAAEYTRERLQKMLGE